MANTANERTVMLKNVRLSFPSLVEPTASIEGGAKKFRANFIIDPTTPEGKKNIREIEAAIAAAEMEEFGKTGIIEKLRDPKRKSYAPGEEFVNQDGDIYAGYEGMMGIKCLSGKRPLLLTRSKDQVPLDEIEDVFQGGYRVNAKINIYCTSKEKQGGRGQFAGVNAIQFFQKDETFGGSHASPDDFDAFEDEEGDDDFG